MKLVFYCWLGLLLTGRAVAQPVANRLITTGEATQDVVADRAVLTVNLSYSDEKDATLVYELHELNRQKLAGLLKALNVPGKDIAYGQLLTRREREFAVGGGTQERFKSFQPVTVRLDDLARFGDVQRRLVADGFAEVAVSFSVSNQPDLENQLLLKAIGRASDKAALMAKAISRTIKRVIRLGDADETDAVDFRSMLVGAPSLNQPRFTAPLNQTSQIIRLSSQVKLVAELE